MSNGNNDWISGHANGEQDKAIELLCKEMTEVKTDVKKLLQDVAALRVKAGLWGGMAGIASAIVAMIIFALKYI